jgi:hypothetical protein
MIGQTEIFCLSNIRRKFRFLFIFREQQALDGRVGVVAVLEVVSCLLHATTLNNNNNNNND